MKAKVVTRIGELKGLVTKTKATALTIDSTIANEEAELKLTKANAKLADLKNQETEFEGEMETARVMMDLAATKAAKEAEQANIDRFKGKMKEIADLRTEQKTIIEGVMKSKDQAKRSKKIAEALAENTDASIASVVKDA